MNKLVVFQGRLQDLIEQKIETIEEWRACVRLVGKIDREIEYLRGEIAVSESELRK